MTRTGPIPALPAARPRRRRRLASLRTVAALMLREMSTTYGRSPGGYLWAVLEPAAGTLLLSAAFATFMSAPLLGTSFPLFYATGIIPFTLFLSVSAAVAQSLNFSRPLLAYPSVTWVDAILARFALNFLTEVMVAYILFACLLYLYEAHALLDLPTIAFSLGLAGALALGVGTLNCFLFTRFPVWQRGWSILMRPMILISGIMILHEQLPHPWQDILWYNPVTHVVGLMRRGFYPAYEAGYVSPGFVLGVGGCCMVAGLVFLGRYHRDLLNQ